MSRPRICVMLSIAMVPWLCADLFAENVIENSSFEAGTGHGWGVSFANRPSRVRWLSYLDSSTAAHGKTSLRIPAKLWRYGTLRRRRFCIETKHYQLTSGGEYTVSMFLKASQPLRLMLSVMGHPDDPKSSTEVQAARTMLAVDTTWKRYDLTATLKPSPEGLYHVRLYYESDDVKPTTVWVDAVQLEAGKLTDYAPRRPVEVGFVCEVPGNIFFEEEPARVTLRAFDRRRGMPVAVVNCTLTDLVDRTVSRVPVVVRLDAKGYGEAPLTLFKGRRGIYRVLAMVTGDDRPAEFVYSVIPRPRHLAERYEPGLMGTDSAGGRAELRVLKRAGYTWVISKIWARWHHVEAEKGKFTFDDDAVNEAVDAKMNVLMQLLWPKWGGPRWATKNMPMPEARKGRTDVWDDANKKQFLKDVSEYTFGVVEHFKGRIKYYELGNEQYFHLTPQQWAEVSAVMYRAAKRADPNCVCVVNTDYRIYSELHKKGRPSYFPIQLEASGPDTIDVVSAHFYTSARHYLIPWNEMLRRLGKPGWNTETGGTATHFHRTLPTIASVRGGKDYWTKTHLPTLLEQTDRYQKNLLLTLAPGGMAKYFHYFTRFSNCSPSQPTRRAGSGKENVEFDGTLRPPAVAQSVASHFLEGCRYDAPLAIDDRIEGYVMTGPGGTRGFFWTTEDRVLDLALPAGAAVKFRDLMTNPLTPKAVGGRMRLRLTPVTVFFTSPLAPDVLRAWFKRIEITDTGKRQKASFAGNFEFE